MLRQSRLLLGVRRRAHGKNPTRGRTCASADYRIDKAVKTTNAETKYIRKTRGLDQLAAESGCSA